jgi:hypothetical protein
MADFTTSYVNGPQNSAITPQAPVTDQSSLMGLSMLDNIAAGVSGFASDSANLRREENKEAAKLALQAQQDQIVSSFVQDQLKLADAVSSGQMPSSQARSMQRANLNRSLANNPGLTLDIGKAHRDIVEGLKVNEEVYEGTDVEKERVRFLKRAEDAGRILPGMNEGQKMEAALDFSEWQRLSDERKEESERVSLLSAKQSYVTGGITQRSAQLSLDNSVRQRNQQQNLAKSSQLYGKHYMNTLTATFQKFQSGELQDPAQAILQIEQNSLELMQLIQEGNESAGADYINNLTRPLLDMKEVFISQIKGEDNKVALENKLKNAQTRQLLATVDASPSFLSFLTLSAIAPQSQTFSRVDQEQAAMKLLMVNSNPDPKKKVVDPVPDTKEGKENLKALFKNTLIPAITQINSKTHPDQAGGVKQINTNLNNLLIGLPAYGPSASGAGDFTPLVEFFADTNVGKYMATGEAAVEVGNVSKAREALKFFYDQEAFPVIIEEFQKARTGGQTVTDYDVFPGQAPVTTKIKSVPVSSVITPVFSGSSIKFDVPVGNTDLSISQKAKHLNDNVAPLVNTLIRSYSHMEGSLDYKAMWEREFKALFEPAEVTETGPKQ